jgi:archaellum component FlaC
LEQLVELTKKYVEKKARQLADKLDKLSEKQDKLAENEKENAVKQKAINSDFEKIQEELKDLDKDNGELKSPVDVPNDAELKKYSR